MAETESDGRCSLGLKHAGAEEGDVEVEEEERNRTGRKGEEDELCRDGWRRSEAPETRS